MLYVYLVSIMRDLACVAASGVRGALGLMRLMMLLSYERVFQKLRAGDTYCGVLKE